jgi:Arc/MetJ-type ribon-helix-helix transcriptional regulator
MRKTSVYLSDELAEGLERVSRRSGKSQSELIREGVQRVVDEAEAPPRVFHSMGKGSGPPYDPWSADELYEKVMGRR